MNAIFISFCRSQINYLKSAIFRDITPCSPLSVNRHFGGTYSACHLLSRRFLAQPFFDPEDVFPKRRLALNGLHGVISEKMVVSITTSVRISNPI
jgi:hypothetical protein